MTRVLVAGAIANRPRSGGEAWVRMSFVRGLRRLGLDVCFVEQIDSAACVDAEGRPAPLERSVNRATFEAVLRTLAPDCPAALVLDGGAATIGLPYQEVVSLACGADLLVNVSGHLTLEPLRSGPRRRAYVDVDPAFTQFWAADGADLGLDAHDTFFTLGENVGAPDCPIPTGGRDWRPLPPPVTLEDWPLAPPPEDPDRFTTVATWRSPLGTLSHGGVTYPGKHHQWRRLLDLPARAPGCTFEIALAIHPGDGPDREALEAAGWHLADPVAAAGDPLAYREYVQGSAAELSVAHGAYVDTASGWISDRTVRYLASGRPALVQDTGAARLGGGEGVVTFSTREQAAEGARRIVADWAAHAQAARALAEAHFDSDRVLATFLAQAGVS